MVNGTFQSKLGDIKKNPPEKLSYISGKRNPEKIVIFSQKKAVLIFQETPKQLSIFQETELSYISGNAYLEPWYIQNPDILRAQGILRTLSNI